MKFNVFFTVKALDKRAEVPNSENPVNALGLTELLEDLREALPICAGGIELNVVGVRIEEVEE